jgi:hypothetical protein
MPKLLIALAKSVADGNICGYGERLSMTLSRSKNRALGIRFSRKVCRPLRPSLGRNQVAQRGTVRGAVEILEGEFFFRAADSSEGVTR